MKWLKSVLVALALVSTAATAQMDNPGAPGNVTAGNGLSQSGSTISIAAPVSVANGGTNSVMASGTALDNITGFTGTGFIQRTGAGAYAFVSATNGITLSNLAQGAANSVILNGTGATANFTDYPMPSCSSSSSAIQWTAGTGFTCGTVANVGNNTNINTLSALVATANNVVTGAGAGLNFVPPSTNAFALVSNGTGAQPSFQLLSADVSQYNENSTGAVGRTVANKLRETFSVLDFACDNTGATDDSTCFQTVINACPTAGCDILLPAGTYKIATFPNLASKTGIHFIGSGGETAGAGAQTIISIATTGNVTAPFISAPGSTNIEFKGIMFVAPASGFNGYIIAAGSNPSNAAFFRIDDCGFFQSGTAFNVSGVNMDATIEWSITRSVFSSLNVAVQMAASGSSFSNVGAIEYSQFINTRSVPLQGGGNAILIANNTFEGFNNGTSGQALAGALSMATTNPQFGLSYLNNWHGDVTTNGGSWVTVSGNGIDIAGDFFGGNASSDAVVVENTSGVHIHGDYFDGFAVAVQASSNNNANLVIEANNYTGVTTSFTGMNGSNTGVFSDGGMTFSSKGIMLPSTTVSALPACNANFAGLQYMVTDANAPSFGNTPAGGGSTKITVFCTGVAWAAG
jgi:hypothetical protein